MRAVAERNGAGLLRSLLDRFRWTSGVPARLGEETTAELEPLCRALDLLERDAAGMRAVAAADQERAAEAASGEIASLLQRAHETAESERARVLRDRLARAEQDAADVRREGRETADGIRAEGERRLPALVAAVVRCVEGGRT